MKDTNVTVERKKNEPLENLISRFKRKVVDESVLKDYKLNAMFSPEERNKFKQFCNRRRDDKKSKRVANAIKRSAFNV